MNISILTEAKYTHGAWLTSDKVTAIYCNNTHGQVIGTYDDAKHPDKAHNKAVSVDLNHKVSLQIVTDKNKIKIIEIEPEELQEAIENMLSELVGRNIEKFAKAKETEL